MQRTVDGDGSDGCGVRLERDLVLGEVGFRLSDELVGRGCAAGPDEGGSVDPGGDGGRSYEGRAQAEEQGESCCEQHIVDG